MSDKFSTFAITFRPRDGVTDEQIVDLVKFIKKLCIHYYIITEKLDDERHVHAAIVTKSPLQRSNVCQRLKNLFKGLTIEEIAVMYKGVKILYSNDFLTKYMDKDDDTVVIERCLPELSYLESFYPPTPVKNPKANRGLAHHQEMEKLQALWYVHVPTHLEINTMNVRDFLFEMQYKVRVIGLMEDKKMFQTARWLVRWMNQVDRCKLEIPCFEKEEGRGLH